MKKQPVTFPSIEFNSPELLDQFWRNIMAQLKSKANLQKFDYSMLKNRNSWSSKVSMEELKKANEHITKPFHGKGKSGVYAIWINRGKGFKIIYIGQTTDHTSHQRIFNHFIAKHPKTGSKLNYVKKEVNQGCQIGLSFVEIFPKEMRHFVEHKIIQKLFGVDRTVETWNVMGKGQQKINV